MLIGALLISQIPTDYSYAPKLKMNELLHLLFYISRIVFYILPTSFKYILFEDTQTNCFVARIWQKSIRISNMNMIITDFFSMSYLSKMTFLKNVKFSQNIVRWSQNTYTKFEAERTFIGIQRLPKLSLKWKGCLNTNYGVGNSRSVIRTFIW